LLNETQLAKHNWRRKQLATLRQAYSAAPHVEETLGLVESVFEIEHKSLAALSAASVEALAEFFDIAPAEVQWSSAMAIEGTGSARVLAICEALGAERYVTGHGAREYLDHESFEAAGVRVEYLDYEKREYPQLHGAFTPFVSALDLAANCGHAGREVIASGTVYWKDFAR
jgi:hypothetical protein